MQILAIDYGAKKIGLAVGDTETKIVEPLMVIRHSSISDALRKLSQVPQLPDALRVIVGLPEGKVNKVAREFGELIRDKFSVEVVFWDEKYSTKDAIEMSIEAGIRQGKRKRMEDAYAAAVILENYLESL